MPNSVIYLDKRRAIKTGEYPLRFSIAHQKSSAYISTGINLAADKWDIRTNKVINHPQKNALNNIISHRHMKLTEALLTLENTVGGRLRSMSATELKKEIMKLADPTLVESDSPKILEDIKEYAKKAKRLGTTKLYIDTYNSIRKYLGESKAKNLRYTDITQRWLEDYDTWMMTHGRPSVNGRASHLKNIRTVFNYAIDLEKINYYPFRKFKIKNEATRKRSLPIDVIAELFMYKPEKDNVHQTEQRAIDVFCMSFALIGMNITDIYQAKKKDYMHGRLSYQRAKTYTWYDIKVYEEAEVRMSKYYTSDESEYLFNFSERYVNVQNFEVSVLNGLRKIASKLGIRELTTYWARHSWATIASSLDIPKDTIARSLGHKSNSITDIYINFDNTKVDKANRQVLDAVNAQCEQLEKDKY